MRAHCDGAVAESGYAMHLEPVDDHLPPFGLHQKVERLVHRLLHFADVLSPGDADLGAEQSAALPSIQDLPEILDVIGLSKPLHLRTKLRTIFQIRGGQARRDDDANGRPSRLYLLSQRCS